MRKLKILKKQMCVIRGERESRGLFLGVEVPARRPCAKVGS